MTIVRMPDGRRIRFPDTMSREEIKNYIGRAQPAREPASSLQPMTPVQREQAMQLARQIRPKNITISDSDRALAESPLARKMSFVYQGMANSLFNPAGYGARIAGVDTSPVEAETATERAIEGASGALYDTIPFVAGGEALANTERVKKAAESAKFLPRILGKGTTLLAKPAAPAYEIAGAIGGAALPVAVNLQHPGENADFWDKAKYYGSNLGLGLAGGLGAMGVVAGGRQIAKKALKDVGKYQLSSKTLKETVPENQITEVVKTPKPKKANLDEEEFLRPTEASRLTTPERLAQNPSLSPEAKKLSENIGRYEKTKNADLIAHSQVKMEGDVDTLKNNLLNKRTYEAQDFEDARQLVSKLFAEGKDEDALTLIKTVSERGSKAGKSVQSMSLWSKMTPEGAVKNAEKIVADYNKAHPKKPISLTSEQVSKIRHYQEQAMRLPEGREKDVYTALSLKAQQEPVPSTLGEKIRSYRNISMLLNAKTLGRNIGGNAGFAGVEKAVVDPLAAVIDKGASLFTGKRTRVMPRFKEYGKGFIQGGKQGAEDVALGINTRNLGGKFDMQPRNSFSGGVLGNAEKALNYGLQTPDRAFYEATFRESMANQMKAQGLKKATKEILQTAEEEALESVFQNRGLISDTVLGFRRGANKLSHNALKRLGINVSDNALGLGDLVIPYAQTPANLVQQSINYSPLGSLKAIGNIVKGNQRAATKDLARSIVGTGGLYGGYELAKNGMLTGDLSPENLSPKEAMTRRKNLELLGIRPNQIKIGDNSYSYGQFAPFSTTLSAGAKLAEGGTMLDSLLAAGGTITDLPFMDNVNKFYRDVTYQGLAPALRNQAAAVPAQFIPTGSNQLGDTIDDTLKETYDPNVLKQGMNTAINKIPYLRNTLPNRVNVLGESQRKYDSTGARLIWDAAINPTFVNARKEQPVIEELERLYQTTGQTKQFFPLADKKLSFKGENDERERKALSPEAYVAYQTVLGKSNNQELNSLMASPYYQNLSDMERVEVIGRIQGNTNTRARSRLFGKERENLRDKKIKSLKNRTLQPLNKALEFKARNTVDDIVNEIYNQ